MDTINTQAAVGGTQVGRMIELVSLGRDAVVVFPPPRLECDFLHGGNRSVNHLPGGIKVCLPSFRGGRDRRVGV